MLTYHGRIDAYRRTGRAAPGQVPGRSARRHSTWRPPANILGINTTQWELRESYKAKDGSDSGEMDGRAATAVTASESGHHAPDHDRPCVWPYSVPWRLIFGSLDRRGREITAEAGRIPVYTGHQAQQPGRNGQTACNGWASVTVNRKIQTCLSPKSRQPYQRTQSENRLSPKTSARRVSAVGVGTCA